MRANRFLFLIGVLAALTLIKLPAAEPTAQTSKKPVSEEYYGTKVEDPYQWLEKDDDPEVRAWSDAHHRPIFLGEFGAYEKGDLVSRTRYDSFVARAAEMHGFPWVYWQFDSDFIVYDVGRDSWVEPILNALIPPKGNAAAQTR